MRRALLLVFLAQGCCFATLIASIPALQDRFALDEMRLGIVLAVVPLIAGAGSLLADRIARRAGVTTVLRLAAPAACAALPGIAAAHRLWALILALTVFALALGSVDAMMNAYGVTLQQRAGRALMSGFHAAYSLGGILGSLAAAAAAGRLPFLLGSVGVVGGLVCLGSGLFLERSTDTREAALRVPGIWRRLAAVGAIMTALFIVDSAVANWGTVFLGAALAAPDRLAALTYGCYAAATLLGRTVADRMVDRFGLVRVVGAGGLLGAAGLLLVVTTRVPAAGLIGFVLTGLGLSLIAPQAFAAAGRAVPERPAAGVARVNVCVYAGFVLGAPLIGTIAALSSLRLAFVIALLLVLALTAVASRSWGNPRSA